jgi:aminoglycoside phosphotransferase (APT) family kinase protein
MGLSRAREFALQRALHRAGLRVAEPLFMCCDADVHGAPFYLMRLMPGEANGARIVASGANEALAVDLADALARLHALDWGERLHILGSPPADAGAARLDEIARLLAADDEPHPVAAWALDWLRGNKPAPAAPVLCHGDFRTGNYLVANRRLGAILDWDFAGWSDPDEDLAWFCSACWRFGAFDREAGGIAGREAFIRAYEARAGRRIDPARLRWWEVMAALRWLAIALKQRDRYLKQGERSLDLALTGRRPAECELEILLLTGGAGRDMPGVYVPDRPSGAALAALARELGETGPLAARCHAIAAREQEPLRDVPATLWAITLAKLKIGNPELLAARGLA